MNFIDKAIGFFDPERALNREVARAKLKVFNSYNGSGSGYGRHGASYGKKSLVSWLTNGKDADADIVDNIETLRNRSRDLYMGSPLATGAIKTVRTNVVGSGLMLNAQIDADLLGLTEDEAREWEHKTEREWRLWSESVQCDAERRQNFYQLQSLVLMSALLSGDVFVTMPMVKRPGNPYDLRIGLIEADRVCDPMSNRPPNANILGGVEIGPYGETVAYWVAKHNPNAFPRLGMNVKQEWKRVLAFGAKTGRQNVLHIMCDVERPAQRRGVPLLAPVIESLKQLTRYSEAELMAAVVAGMFTVFIKLNNPSEGLAPAVGGVGGYDPARLGQNQIPRDPNDYALGNGSIVALEENESIEIADPKRPNSAFDGFVTAVCRQIGSALEIPYELLIKNFTASYSASRASLLEAWKMFRMRREWLVSSFCQPVYEEWLTEAILKGRIDAPGFFADPSIRAAWCGADWYGDAQGQLDPLKEANAAKVRVEEGFSTREREAAELTGMKFETIVSVRKREEAMRKEANLIKEPTQPAPVAPTQKDDDEDE